MRLSPHATFNKIRYNLGTNDWLAFKQFIFAKIPLVGAEMVNVYMFSCLLSLLMQHKHQSRLRSGSTSQSFILNRLKINFATPQSGKSHRGPLLKQVNFSVADNKFLPVQAVGNFWRSVSWVWQKTLFMSALLVVFINGRLASS